tara:strand:+ start:112 stop:243 length:132 start_codon:yes stop_codon:yes gene_type:complete
MTKWNSPKIEEIGDAKDLILELGGGKEPGPSDDELSEVQIQFS